MKVRKLSLVFVIFVLKNVFFCFFLCLICTTDWCPTIVETIGIGENEDVTHGRVYWTTAHILMWGCYSSHT